MKTQLKNVLARPCLCAGQRSGACQLFSKEEMLDQLRKLKTKKASGPDDVCAEHKHFLAAQDALLHQINASWSSATVPSA